MIEKPKVNYKSLVKLASECLFYGLLSGVIILIFYLKNFRFNYNVKDLLYYEIKCIFNPVSSSVWWFISVYFIIVLFSPVINSFFTTLSKKGQVFLLVIFWIFEYVISMTFDGYYANLQRGVFFYLLGCFVRQSYRTDKHRRPYYFIFSVIFWLICAFNHYVYATYYHNDIESYFRLVGKISNLLSTAFWIPLCAFFIFNLFASFTITSSRINLIASTTFGIYLLHDSLFGENVLWPFLLQTSSQYKSSFFIIYAVFSIAVVFWFCSIIDIIRQRFIDRFYLNLFTFLYNRIRSI